MIPAIVGWSHMWWPERKRGRRSASFAGFYRNACRSTWCQQHSFFSAGCPLPRAARSTGERYPHPDRSRPDLGRVTCSRVRRKKHELHESGRRFLVLDTVGIEDNFFELGGHSLLATRVISRIRDAFGIEVPLRSLFESPTVAGLAREIGEAGQEASHGIIGNAEPPIPAGLRMDPCPLSFAQQRLWFFEQLHPGSAVYHLSTVLPFEGPLDRQALEDSLADLLDRHEALRTTFTAVDGVPVQLIAPSLRIDLPLVDVSQPAGRLSWHAPAPITPRTGRPLRSCPRPAAARQPGAPREGLSLAGAGAASYRGRWLVAGDPAPRSSRPLCRQGERRTAAAAGTADPVRRLRLLAAAHSTGRAAERTVRLLAKATGGCAGAACPAFRPAASGTVELSRRALRCMP